MASGTIIGLLLGAGLTFAVQALLQLFIVPRVETRKRREDRWERDVLALGDLLVQDLPNAARDVQNNQRILHFMDGVLRNGDNKNYNLNRVKELIPEKERELQEVADIYRELVATRVDWLVERIKSIAPESITLTQLEVRWRAYYLTYSQCMLYGVRTSDYDDERFHQAWAAEHLMAGDLRTHVRQLALNRRPPRRLVRRGYFKRIFNRAKQV